MIGYDSARVGFTHLGSAQGSIPYQTCQQNIRQCSRDTALTVVTAIYRVVKVLSPGRRREKFNSLLSRSCRYVY